MRGGLRAMVFKYKLSRRLALARTVMLLAVATMSLIGCTALPVDDDVTLLVSCLPGQDCNFVSSDGRVQLFIPAAAIPETGLDITAQPAINPTGSMTLVPGTAWDVGPTGTTFSPRAQLTVDYDAASVQGLAGVRQSELGVYKDTGQQWGLVDSMALDTASNELTAWIAGLSVYGILGAPVDTVLVSPSPASVVVGQTLQLTAEPRSADQMVLPDRPVTWSTGDPAIATVDAGLVTAVAVGTAIVTASSQGVSGSSTVTVNTSASAADTVFADGFESGNLSAWHDLYETVAGNFSVLTDPGTAFEGSRMLAITYPAGAGDGAGALSHFLLPGYERMRVRYAVRFPPDWQGGTKLLLLRGSRTDNQWSSFGVAGSCPDGTDFFLANVVTRDQVELPLRFYTYYVGMPEERLGGLCYGRYGDPGFSGPAPPATYFPPLDVSKGVWHVVELEVELNTPGEANGVQRMWLDGELRGEWTGLTFRTTDVLRLNAVTLESSMNETQGGAPQTQILLVDDVVVTVTRQP